MRKTNKGTLDFTTYAIGLLTVIVGAIVCYTLAVLGQIAETDTAFMLTIAATVGFALSTTSVTLRARRLGRDTTGPLVFGTGLLLAMGGSLAVYTLTLYGVISKTGATLAFASVSVLSLVLVIAGIARRAYYIERKASRMVVMQPLRRVYIRKVEKEQDGQNG